MKIINMKTKLPLIILVIAAFTFKGNAQTPSILWQKVIGGNGNDSLTCLQPTPDGGFIACGISKSNISGNKTQNSFGGFDYWVIKLDAAGNILWNKTLGGIGDDLNPVVIQTSDFGFLIGGKSISDSSGTKTEYAINKSFDYWVVKLDKNGNYKWDNTIGSIQLEYITGLAEAADGGYILSGNAHSNAGDDKHEQNRGSSLWSDYWVVKVKKNKGKIAWDRTFGGGNLDITTCIKATADGNFILGGHSYSPAEFEKTDSFIGNNDYWVVKIDQAGNRISDKVYGGVLSDYQTSIDQTKDGGYILGGYSNSPVSFNKSQQIRGVTDYWIIKTNAANGQVWDKTYGSSGADYLTSIQQTADKGFILGGYSNSPAAGEKSENSRGDYDGWIIKTDSLGNKQWDKTYGGSLNDRIATIREISSGEYIVGVASNSPVSGEKTLGTVGNTGAYDFWILRLSTAAGFAKQPKAVTAAESVITIDKSAPITRTLSMFVSPNPAKNTANVTYNSTTNKKISLKVFDISGKTVFSNNLTGVKGSYAVDITRLAPGTYYFVLSNGASTVTKTVIKE